MGVQAMNVFNLLIVAIVAVALIGVLFFNFGSFFVPQTNLAKHADGLLLEAQADLGKNKSITLSLKEGDTIYARNLDETTRTVSFACSTEACCPTLTNCTQPLSSTVDRIRVNQGIKTTLTARCVPLNDLHACKLYIGKEPAQLDLVESAVPSTFAIQGTTDIPITTTIQNLGEIVATNVEISADLSQDQTVGGKIVPVKVGANTFTVESLLPGKKQLVALPISLTQTGTFHLLLHAETEMGGYDEETYTITVTGSNAVLCARDLSKSEAAQYDGIDHICRKKVFCTGCGFAFECRSIWEKEAPLTGGGSYDPDQGAPTYSYQVWPSTGTC